ncbi:MAG: signal peptidase I [Deltaproteobacteria bacterium]|nr:signal peptidase I [Deltaproteobacteria bacterium]
MKKLIGFSFMSLIVFLILCGRIVADDGMNTTLHDGDFTIVLPLEPKVGDVVSIIDPLESSGKEVFRRVIACEGVELSYDRNGTIIYDGRRITQRDMGVFGSYQAIEEKFEDTDGTTKKWTVTRLIEPIVSFLSNVRVPVGHVFLLADQRDEGLDSRIWGTIPKENITGVVFFRIGKAEPWGSRITWWP